MGVSDPAIEQFGISVTNGADDTVTASITVDAQMLNSHGVCHGGIIFLLADSVMDYCTNGTLAEDALALAAHGEVDYVRPAHQGDVLTATGHITDTWGRTTLVDVTVSNQRGEVVTHFRGRTRTMRRGG